MVNLSAFIRFHALRTPDRLALVYGDQRISYADFLDRIGRMAAFLHRRGVREGDVVAVVMKNSAAFLEIAFAASHLGAVFLPINYRLAAPEVAFITGNAGAMLVFADTELAAAVEDDPNAVLVDAAAQADGRTLAGTEGPVPPMRVRGTQDLFRLMYTSGTTDHPKGVMHSYENFYWKCMDHVTALGLTAEDRLLAVGPLYHVGAFDLPGLAVLWLGGTICLLRDFDPDTALAAIERERLTGAWFAPVMVGRILSHPERGRYDVSSLKWAIGGGERTPEQRIRDFTGLFANARYIDGYGLTESCSGDTLMEAGREIEKIGSTGRALAHVEIDIRDDAGTSLPAGEVGEICLRGPKVTKGYWKDPEKTARSFYGDWFRTGDVGYLDADGFLFLTDRKKDMIISGGENIASSEIERVVFLLPQVVEVAVIAVPDERWGEVPAAVVVLKEGESLDAETLEQHCRRHLAGFKVPKRLLLREALPRNPSGKVLKRVLRDELAPTHPEDTP
ncbi:AMP-binding protein [Azospirillum sp. YIM DDC1]|uniref:AMP-binding protein n=1 Tax=Azospirillum aestuarii TaxID=2802052 RepID=A0ABS1I1B1_9PROT|nr:AMP-binding protein [Azospirillum aestuarii]TWA78495.1 acyl-CoA synthetase (AMP-forming)/AMP-acid ligase II [Azospirillum brasilense]